MQLSLINPVDEMGAEQSDAPWPIIIRKGECIGMKEAEDLSGASGKSIARYCKTFGIGAHAMGVGRGGFQHQRWSWSFMVTFRRSNSCVPVKENTRA